MDSRRGFTLMELLMVISLLGVLATGSMINVIFQLHRSFDIQRKDNLKKLSEALEHYADDHGCYPDPSLWNCSSTIFAPYNMPQLLCDPETKIPYYYLLIDPGNACAGFRLYTTLRDQKDPDINRVGCFGSCGVTGHPELNYGVSSGAPVKL